MPDQPQSNIDRAALDRIIQRAAELQTNHREIGDNLSTNDVLALGKDVGIPSRYLHQAMLEEGSRTTMTGTGILHNMVGPVEVTAQRVVQGEVEEVERALLTWMKRNELVSLQRQQPGRITWEPLTGMQAALRRGASVLESGKAKFALDKTDLVTAMVTPLETGYCHVTIAASLKSARSRVITAAAILTSAGGIGSAVLFVLNAFWMAAVAPIPMAIVIGYASLRSFRPLPARVQVVLERALDDIERLGAKPPSALPERGTGVLDLIADQVRKALTAPVPPKKPL